MKKFISVVAAAAVTLSALAANASDMLASFMYDDSTSKSDLYYYCIMKLEDEPLACYDYAKKNGVDEFIFTEEGQTAYTSLMTEHETALQNLDTYLGREVGSIYDYTAVYNGFSTILSYDEYVNVYKNKESVGLENIYLGDMYYGEADDVQATVKKSTSSVDYTGMTQSVREKTGINKVDIKGESTVIAIIDNEFDTSHEFISSMPDNSQVRLDEEAIDSISPYLSATGVGGEGYYLNEKIPYRFNYDTFDTDTSADDPDESHGTHVAGIAAGNGDAVTDSSMKPYGTAANAQLALMSGLANHEVMAAYDDCAYIGADVVNASYGRSYASSASCPYESEAIKNLNSCGTLFCAAAGNESKIGYEGADSLLNTDYASGGVPCEESAALAVASADNPVRESKIIEVGGNKYPLNPGTNDITAEFPDKKLELAVIPGYGYSEDYEGIDVEGKVVLVKRGEIGFEEKGKIALDKGAVGIIFYNSENTSTLSPSCYSLPCGIISSESGLAIVESGKTDIKINSASEYFMSDTSTMNDFSSWCYTEELILKPEITSFGGNIISSLSGNKYGKLSGTSMAAPQLTGISALVREYLENNKEKYGIESESDYPEMIAKLLMSTASPVNSSSSAYVASPRVQGSGLVNVKNAIDTPAYLYTDSESDRNRPKLSLGDNIEDKIGTAEFSAEKFYFHIKNISDTEQTYSLSADLMSDAVNEEGNLAQDAEPLSESRVIFKYGFTEINEITVGPGEDVIVGLDIDLSADEQKLIEENFENGTFIDGFVHLTSDSAPALVLPFTGYYGSWSAAEIFEPFIYKQKAEPSFAYSIMRDSNANTAGVNMLGSEADDGSATGMPVYSPNGDNVLDDIVLLLGFKRRCRNVTVEIYKNRVGRVYQEQVTLDTGSWEASILNGPAQMSYFINWDFEGASDGDIYEIRVTAEKPLSSITGGREILSQEFTIDKVLPEIGDCKRLIINCGEDNHESLMVNVTDNRAVQGIAIIGKDGEEEYLYDAAASSDFSTKEFWGSVQIPEELESYSVEAYDTAGNCVALDNKSITDTYTLSCDENMFFSTNDKSFKNKISFKDANGKDVSFSLSSTPEKVYNSGSDEVSVMYNSFKIADIPVQVGLAGDCDLNDTVNLYDAIKISKYLLWTNNPNGTFKNEFTDFEGSIGEYLADYDKNGRVDLYDAIAIAKLLLPTNK